MHFFSILFGLLKKMSS